MSNYIQTIRLIYFEIRVRFLWQAESNSNAFKNAFKIIRFASTTKQIVFKDTR